MYKQEEKQEWVTVTFKLPVIEYNKLEEAVQLSGKTKSEICRLLIVNNLMNMIDEYNQSEVRITIRKAELSKLKLLNLFNDILRIYGIQGFDNMTITCTEIVKLLKDDKVSKIFRIEMTNCIKQEIENISKVYVADVATLENVLKYLD